jgi:hypothetical protein
MLITKNNNFSFQKNYNWFDWSDHCTFVAQWNEHKYILTHEESECLTISSAVFGHTQFSKQPNKNYMDFMSNFRLLLDIEDETIQSKHCID